ncbi:MAG: RIP metalloprotease RseP [Verrucomicrobia bacterium]|nr:RIP metalloprotease RseP [Cytophagales bacterium]
MEVLVRGGQFILALSLLIVLHEFGHYITARWFKMRVNKFYLFFDFLFPFAKIMNFSLLKIKKGDTEYGIGWFPLGGYVDIAGMIDETKTAADLASEPQPWEFRAKPAWQRLIVMLGGIIVNVILGVTIFIMLFWIYGEKYLPANEVDGIVARPIAEGIGLKTGDKIIAVNGKTVEKFSDLTQPGVLLGDASFYTIVRDGKTKDVYLPKELLNQLSDRKNRGQFIEPLLKFSVEEVLPNSAAAKAGLQAQDKILKVNEVSTVYFNQFQEALQANKDKKVTLLVERKGQQLPLEATVTKEGTLGFKVSQPPFKTQPYSFGQALLAGPVRAFEVIENQFLSFGKIFSGQINPRKALGGPVGIAELFPTTWNWEIFWNLAGLLSMVLAFMNLLPIPLLDGGHVVFLLYEMIAGRKPSDRFLEVANSIGLFLVLGLMVFAIFNDIINRLF